MRHLFLLLLTLVLAATAQAATPEDVPVKGSFSWGAEAGASIDLTGHDMSAIEFNASFGYKRGWIKFIGAGVGADILIFNSCRSYPLYIDFRTNFSQRSSLCFWDLKLGASLNYLPNNNQQTGAYGFTGVGVNLASSAKFQSYILLGYTFRERRDFNDGEELVKLPSLHYATVRLGVSF